MSTDTNNEIDQSAIDALAWTPYEAPSIPNGTICVGGDNARSLSLALLAKGWKLVRTAGARIASSPQTKKSIVQAWEGTVDWPAKCEIELLRLDKVNRDVVDISGVFYDRNELLDAIAFDDPQPASDQQAGDMAAPSPSVFAELERERLGKPGTTPIGRILHTLLAHASTSGDQVVLEGTSGIYGDGVKTGITLDDLRELAKLAEDPTEAQAKAVSDVISTHPTITEADVGYMAWDSLRAARKALLGEDYDG